MQSIHADESYHMLIYMQLSHTVGMWSLIMMLICHMSTCTCQMQYIVCSKSDRGGRPRERNGEISALSAEKW